MPDTPVSVITPYDTLMDARLKHQAGVRASGKDRIEKRIRENLPIVLAYVASQIDHMLDANLMTENSSTYKISFKGSEPEEKALARLMSCGAAGIGALLGTLANNGYHAYPVELVGSGYNAPGGLIIDFDVEPLSWQPVDPYKAGFDIVEPPTHWGAHLPPRLQSAHCSLTLEQALVGTGEGAAHLMAHWGVVDGCKLEGCIGDGFRGLTVWAAQLALRAELRLGSMWRNDGRDSVADLDALGDEAYRHIVSKSSVPGYDLADILIDQLIIDSH